MPDLATEENALGQVLVRGGRPAQEVAQAIWDIGTGVSTETFPKEGEEPSVGETFKAGFRQSALALSHYQELVDIDEKLYKELPILKKTLFQAGSFTGDFPAMIPGFLAGTAAGAPTGPGAIITGFAGAFALPAGLRRVYADRIRRGEVATFSEWWNDRLIPAVSTTLKAQVVGGATGAANAFVPGLGKVPAEIATMVTMGAALEGHMPEAEDFVSAAILIGGMRGVSRISQKLVGVYEKTGKAPEEILRDIREDLSIKTDLRSEEVDTPTAYTEAAKPKDPTVAVKKQVDQLEEPILVKGFKEKAKHTLEGVREGIQSPRRVYETGGKIGKEIYDTIDRADQQKNAFLVREGKEFTKAAGKIKEGSESSETVGKALEAKAEPEKLSPEEQRLHGFLKKKFDFLLKHFARTRTETEEGYQKVLRIAARDKAAAVKVKDLPEKQLKKYKTLKSQLSKIREGKKVAELEGVAKDEYWEARRKMRSVLEEEYVKILTTGEREALDILQRKIKDYLPHIFDQDQLLGMFREEMVDIKGKLETATDKGAVTGYKNRLRKLNEAVTRLEQGYLITYRALPQNVRFRFFETRKGREGYSFDAVKAYQTYLAGLAKKIYDEPAIRKVARLHPELKPSLKAYNKWYVRRYMGWEKHKLDDFAGYVASFQWMRTLGLNPRSAIVNLTQRINTVAEVGVEHSLKGERLAFTKKGKELFDKTGISKEVPTVLMEGPVPEGMERVRAVLGFMFNKVELGNRRHAFLSAYSKYKGKGLPDAEAHQRAINIVHKTQFRYGKVGMPKVLTHPAGRLAGQFWSYPIKQVELIIDWAKNSPVKLVKYLVLAEGGRYALNEFLGIDLSNALGFGITWGEAIKAIQSVPEGDWRGFFRHLRLVFSGGGGLLPSGLGPTASGAIKVTNAISRGKGAEQLKKELTPIQWKRFAQAYESIKGKQDELYPIYDNDGYIMYYLSSKELLTRTIGPRPIKESEEYREWRQEVALEQERKEVLVDIIKALVDGKDKKANKLMEKYYIVPAPQSLVNEVLKRQLSKAERKLMKKPGKAEQYKTLRGE